MAQLSAWFLPLVPPVVYNTHTEQNTFLKAKVKWRLGKLPVEENCDIHSAACLDSNWRSVLNLETTALTSAFAKTTRLAGIMSGSRGSSENHKTRHSDPTRCSAVQSSGDNVASLTGCGIWPQWADRDWEQYLGYETAGFNFLFEWDLIFKVNGISGKENNFFYFFFFLSNCRLFSKNPNGKEDIYCISCLFWFFSIPEDWSQEKRLWLLSNIPKNTTVAAVCGWRRRKNLARKVWGGCANQ